ncbi:MAG TPA: arginine-tRNA-protein transferase [Verrucomicrobiota bacterium]|nr:arginine-tRNA-protein transferase [Verrucomicrobiota bacterium]
MSAWPRVEQVTQRLCVMPTEMDELWSQGWRHFASVFFRYSVTVHEGRVVTVVPLRIRLEDWKASTSQARIARRNGDLEVAFVRPGLDAEHRHLFHRHVQRFTSNVPEHLENFVGPDPGRRRAEVAYPCECIEVSVRRQGVLVAASYLDVGRESASSVYGMFDLAEGRRSLGIATLLWEIGYARERGCRFLYPGYVFAEPSPYDYKKRLGALEAYDWREWRRWDLGRLTDK